MPQIANQDYNVIAPQYADNIVNDASALGMLVGHIERGTIWDTILKNPCLHEEPGANYARIFSIDGGYLYFFEPYNGENTQILLEYSSTQYEGLAAVQVACELTDELPELTVIGGMYLREDRSEKYPCVDGKLVTVTLNDEDKIVALQVSSESPSDEIDWVNVPFEELQKLIGLPTV